MKQHSGYWCLSGSPQGFCISTKHRPRLIHRTFMRLLLGITWVSELEWQKNLPPMPVGISGFGQEVAGTQPPGQYAEDRKNQLASDRLDNIRIGKKPVYVGLEEGRSFCAECGYRANDDPCEHTGGYLVTDEESAALKKRLEATNLEFSQLNKPKRDEQ